MIRIGGLWQKEKDDRTYLSGQLEIDGKKINILIFPNDRKEKEAHPDFNVMAKEEGDLQKKPGYAPKPKTEAARPNWKTKTNIFSKG